MTLTEAWDREAIDAMRKLTPSIFAKADRQRAEAQRAQFVLRHPALAALIDVALDVGMVALAGRLSR